MEISTTVLKEKGTGVICGSFTDEAGSAVAPETLSWTLTDMSGTVINSREAVDAAAPISTTECVVLSGDDLAIQSGETEYHVARVITFSGTYNSTYGNDLPLKKEVKFYVENLGNIT